MPTIYHEPAKLNNDELLAAVIKTSMLLGRYQVQTWCSFGASDERIVGGAKEYLSRLQTEMRTRFARG